MYVIGDCSLGNIDTMLNKTIIKCFAEEELVELDYNIIDDTIDKKLNVDNPLNSPKPYKHQYTNYKYATRVKGNVIKP